jgi:hypothetical protein
MAAKKSALEEAQQKVDQLQTEEDRVSSLDSRSNSEKGDPWRETIFLLAILGLTIVLCLMVMLFLADG